MREINWTSHTRLVQRGLGFFIGTMRTKKCDRRGGGEENKGDLIWKENKEKIIISFRKRTHKSTVMKDILVSAETCYLHLLLRATQVPLQASCDSLSFAESVK